jgi:hypothetical protein
MQLIISTTLPNPQMAPKKRPQPLARSLKLIEEERVNVARLAWLFECLMFRSYAFVHGPSVLSTAIP